MPQQRGCLPIDISLGSEPEVTLWLSSSPVSWGLSPELLLQGPRQRLIHILQPQSLSLPDGLTMLCPTADPKGAQYQVWLLLPQLDNCLTSAGSCWEMHASELTRWAHQPLSRSRCWWGPVSAPAPVTAARDQCHLCRNLWREIHLAEPAKQAH